MSSVRERFDALVAEPYNSGSVPSSSLADEIKERIAAAFEASLPTDRTMDRNAEVYRDAMWTAFNNLPGMGANLNLWVHAWWAAEIDLLFCPVVEGDRMEILMDYPSGASILKGALVKFLNYSGAGSLVVVEEDDDQTWYLSRPQARLLVSGEFPAISSSLMDQIVGTEVLDRYNSLIVWAKTVKEIPFKGVDDAATFLTENGCWGGVEWCSTGDGKDYLGRVLRYARERIVREHLSQQPEEMPERVFTAPVQNEEVQRLTEQVASLEQQLREQSERITTFRSNVEHDFNLIGEVLGQKADERGLCSEYDDAIRRANRDLLSGYEIPPRSSTHEVRVRGWIRVPFEVTFEVEVGRGEDVEEEAQSYFDNNFSASSMLRNDEYDRYSAEFEDDYEIEEQ